MALKTNREKRPEAKKRGRPRTNPRDQFPIVTSCARAHEVTGIPIVQIWRMRDYALTDAFRHGKIYTGELARDYRKIQR